MRVCAEPGCPTLSPNTRCPTHTRGREHARGSRQDRGYDAEHDRVRRAWAPRVALGLVQCWRCRRLIAGNEPWDLGHDDDDRTKYRGPEHMRCNRAVAGR